jgi:hypothetical protein
MTLDSCQLVVRHHMPEGGDGARPDQRHLRHHAAAQGRKGRREVLDEHGESDNDGLGNAVAVQPNACTCQLARCETRLAGA